MVTAARTGKVPPPASEYGPCLFHCQHADCAALRRMAEADCVICLAPIGFDRAYIEHRLGLAHATCAGEKSQGDF